MMSSDPSRKYSIKVPRPSFCYRQERRRKTFDSHRQPRSSRQHHAQEERNHPSTYSHSHSRASSHPGRKNTKKDSTHLPLLTAATTASRALRTPHDCDHHTLTPNRHDRKKLYKPRSPPGFQSNFFSSSHNHSLHFNHTHKPTKPPQPHSICLHPSLPRSPRPP